MREWAERTAERILASRPRRVLEIGCGTGLLLFRIAPHCERYVGTDFSETAIRRLETALSAAELPQVTLWRRPADLFDGVQPASFDAVVLNSVVQYFPGVDYLLRVLEGAVRAVAPGGHVFVGDVRSLPLLEAYHASVEMHRAPASWSREELGERVREQLAREEELVVDPDLFDALRDRLPRITEVLPLVKRGRHHNELTRFRYDVVLRVEGGDPRLPEGEALDWQALGLTVAEVERRLRDRQPEGLRLAGVPDARLQTERRLLHWLHGAAAPATVGEWRQSTAAGGAGDGVDPEALAALASELSYEVEVGTHDAGGRFDVVLRRRPAAPHESSPVSHASAAVSPRPWSSYTNDPLHGLLVRRLVPEVGRYLGSRLPAYMVPSAFVVLDALPLTPSGKVDRGALPAPDWSRGRTKEAPVAPRTPTEVVVANAFCQVLGAKAVSVHDRFFEIGGHSLLATQVVSRLREALQVDVPLRLLFEEPTVAGLAAALLADSERGTHVADVAEILLKVARLSEDEAESLLAGGRDHTA
jgi:SAM-dependent methyltransferase